MKNKTIIRRIQKALEELSKLDSHLIKNDLSEQSITHMLAMRLMPHFKNYDVDCEYNGNVLSKEGKRKQIQVLKEKLEEHKLLRKKEGKLGSVITRSVFPDIIIS